MELALSRHSAAALAFFGTTFPVRSSIPASSETPEFFRQLSDEPNPSWVGSHVYLIATVLIVAATIAVVLWRF